MTKRHFAAYSSVQRNSWSHASILLLLAFTLSACDGAVKTSPGFESLGSCSNRKSPYDTGATERTYCSTAVAYPTPVIISGTAQYEFRTFDTTDNSGLSAIQAPNPIRYAEVVAYSANGEIAQCAETNATGQFSLVLPQSSSSFEIKVFSRGDNSSVKASVMNCPEEKIPYSIATSVMPDMSKNIGSITASADNASSLMGAAFNIFDKIVSTNDFLRTHVGACAPVGCTDFTVAPKVEAYWAKGFNPNDYFNSSSGLSFYLPTYSRLFILGGLDGDILNSDTDHFDNSIIVHEYGHFIEDLFTNTDSPGGSHSGNATIDPRLAFGEGWGNFIQAAVLNSPYYRDTTGTPGGTSSNIFNISLEPNTVAGSDVPIDDYEGNFREFSVTRLMWDVFDGGTGGTDSDGDIINNKFDDIWYALTWTSGFRNSLEAFRNMGLLHHKQINDLGSGSDWSSLRTAHKQGDAQEYAFYVTRQTPDCSFTMDPRTTVSDTGSFSTSNRVRNNDFFYYRHSGGAFNLVLTYQTIDTGGPGYTTEQESDADLYIYNESGRYGVAADIVGSSQDYFDNDAATIETETVNLSNLAAGNYLINVKLYTGNYSPGSGDPPNLGSINTGDRIPAGDDFDYLVRLNGQTLCGATRP